MLIKLTIKLRIYITLVSVKKSLFENDIVISSSFLTLRILLFIVLARSLIFFKILKKKF